MSYFIINYVCLFFRINKCSCFFIMMQIEVLFVCRPKVLHLIDMLHQELLHILDSAVNDIFFCTFSRTAIVNVKVSILLISDLQLAFYRRSINFVFWDEIRSFLLKSSGSLINKISNKSCASFYHDNKAVSTLIHVVNVLHTKVPTVKNESNLLVSITLGLI